MHTTNNLIKVITTKGESFFAKIPDAIEKSRNCNSNAVAWAHEVFNDVKQVQFAREEPATLACLIDIEGFAIPVWEFLVFVPFMKPEEFNSEDECLQKIENWLDTRIYNMSSWAERN